MCLETIQFFYTEEKPLVTKRKYKFKSSLRKMKKCLLFFMVLEKQISHYANYSSIKIIAQDLIYVIK